MMRMRAAKYLILALGISVLALVFCFISLAGPDNPVTQVGSNFQLCTLNVSQPACYDTAYPTPTLNWSFASWDTGWGQGVQTAYWAQIDDDGNEEGVYPSPEVDTGPIPSSAVSHSIPEGPLQFNTTYYWKVAVKDSFGTWSGWTCADVPFTTSPSCATEPMVTDLETTYGDWCTDPARYFSWVYFDPNGKDQSRFRFQADDNLDFSSPEIDRNYSGLSNPNLSTNNQTVEVVESPGSDQFGYNTTYYWRVKVWNSSGERSAWNTGPAVVMPAHRWPTIIMSWSPALPDVDENIDFSDQSVIYGGASVKKRDWTFEDGHASSPSAPNPNVRFPTAGFKEITLTVEDSDGYVCTGAETVIVGKDVPFWKEILPW